MFFFKEFLYTKKCLQLLGPNQLTIKKICLQSSVYVNYLSIDLGVGITVVREVL